MPATLLSFVDPKDPFLQSEIAGEELTGPVLSILAARRFDRAILFHTHSTKANAQWTEREIGERHPGTKVTLRELAATGPKDYSGIMGALAREVRGLPPSAGPYSVCVSSGTAEMRASWFLLEASGVLPATLLQAGSPAEPLFGPAHVREVRLDGGDWHSLRDLVMPQEFFGAPADECADFLMAAPAPPPAPAPSPALETAAAAVGLFIGSAILQERAATIAMAAPTDAPILLLGETGTGKDVFARLAHSLSLRADRPLVTINCGALAPSLIDDHLFGHVRGAFTDAKSDRRGAFEEAHNATVFLDEIGELSLEAQTRLLRVLGNGEVQRLGSNKIVRVDVRVIAATNRDLSAMINAKTFRDDLYYRLSVIPVRIPPLRERRAEIATLAPALLKNINMRRRNARQLSKDAIRRLQQHDWPGNVRELISVLERSCTLSPAAVLEPEHILIDPQPGADPLAHLPQPHEGFDLQRFLDQIRNHLILRALDAAGNNQTDAAALLGISKQAVNQFLKDNAVKLN